VDGLVELGLGLAHLGPYRILEARGGLAEAVAHLAQLVELNLAVDVGLHVAHVALQAPGQVAERARHPRQLLGPDHDQGHEADDHELGESYVEHAGRKALRSLQMKKAPGRTPLVARRQGAQALDSARLLTSPSTVLFATWAAGRWSPSSPGFSPPSRMPSLKPRTAPPRSAPMLRSFLVPKISITMTRTISQCQMLNEPMVVSLRSVARYVAPAQHRPERLGPAQHMHVDMIHLLVREPAVVDDGAEPVVGARLARQPPGHRQHAPERRLVGGLRLVEIRHVRLRDDEDVHRRLRPDVVEGEHELVLVGLLRRNLALDDLAENAIRVVHALLRWGI